MGKCHVGQGNFFLTSGIHFLRKSIRAPTTKPSFCVSWIFCIDVLRKPMELNDFFFIQKNDPIPAFNFPMINCPSFVFGCFCTFSPCFLTQVWFECPNDGICWSVWCSPPSVRSIWSRCFFRLEPIVYASHKFTNTIRFVLSLAKGNFWKKIKQFPLSKICRVFRGAENTRIW